MHVSKVSRGSHLLYCRPMHRRLLRYLPDGLLSLGLADLRLLVPLGHDLSQGGPSDRPLELHSASGTLLCHLFLFRKNTYL